MRYLLDTDTPSLLQDGNAARAMSVRYLREQGLGPADLYAMIDGMLGKDNREGVERGGAK